MVVNPIKMDSILLTYSANLRPVIKSVINCDDFGVAKTGVKAIARDCTRLLLQIPYATRMLSWEVLFLADNLSFAPDFYFDDEFLVDPDPDVFETNIPALSSWNLEDSNALLNVIKQLLVLYKKEQLRVLGNDVKLAKIYSEYKEILQSNNEIKKNSIEIIISRGMVHFLVAMNVDFSGLPPYSFPLVFSDMMDPGENVAYLHIAADVNAISRCYQAVLKLSPQVELALGGESTMHIPPLNANTHLSDYVTQVCRLLKDKVAVIAEHYHKKMDFINQLLQLTNVLEYDVVKFEQISFLFGDGDNLAHVIISIDAAFPQERPKVKINSIIKEQNGKPKTVNVHAYLYNPLLPTEAIINNIFAKLKETMRTFD